MSSTRQPEGARHVLRPSYTGKTDCDRIICAHGHEWPNKSPRILAKAIQEFAGSCASAAPNPATVPGLLTAGPEKDERCRSDLVAWVDEKLCRDCSPERIVGRLRLDYPEVAGMRISGRPSAAGSLQPHNLAMPAIVICAVPPAPQAARQVRLFPGRIDIARRPQPVADRYSFGVWEADLVCASRGKTALLSYNERKSRFLVLAKAQSKTAAASGEALFRVCVRYHQTCGRL